MYAQLRWNVHKYIKYLIQFLYEMNNKYSHSTDEETDAHS